MSKLLEIVVNKADTFKEVRRLASYIGKKALLDGSEFERIVAVEEDSAVLEESWRVACTEMDKTLSEYIYDSNHGEDDSYCAYCRMPDNWNMVLGGDVSAEVSKYIQHSVTAAWMAIVRPEEVKQQAEYMNAAVGNLRSTIYSRQRPRKMNHHHHCGF